MKKLLLSLSLLTSVVIAQAQSFTATYSFAAVSNTTGLVDPSPVPVATGVTFGSFTSVGGGTVSSAQNPNATGRFVYGNWPVGSVSTIDTYSTMTASISLTRYYEVIISPSSGYNVILDNIAFGSRRSGTGIRSYAVRSSADGFNSNLVASVGTNTNLSVVGTNEFFWNFDATSTTVDQNGSMVSLNTMTITTPLTIRFYAWNAEASTGNFSLDNVIVTGTAVATSTCATSSVSVVGQSSVTCNGLSNGSATITATDNGPFTYTWMPSGGNNDYATGLSAGLYTCAVTNSCGTVSHQTVSIMQPTQLLLSANYSAIMCNGGATSVTVSATGGTAPYMYMPSSNTVTAGNYTYTVTDANNCMAIKTITVTQPAAISKTQTITLCAGQTATVGTSTYSASGTYTNVLASVNGCDSTVISTVDVLSPLDGSVSLSGQTLMSAQSGATYQWIDCNNGNAAIPSATMQSYVAGTNGNYAVIITMGNCSITSTCTAVNSVTCSVPTVSVTGIFNVTCFGLSNGSATITATNNGPFTYTWMPSGGNSDMASGLSAGLYTCAVTNSCGAVSHQTVSIMEPAQLVLSANYSAIMCNGGSTSVTVSATGGTASYMYMPGSNTVTAGNYTYTVTDANNCMAIKTITVTQPAAISKTQTITLCAGQTATVGTSTYSASGTYTNVLAAVNGCDSTVISTVNVLNAIDESVTMNGLTLTANQAGATYQWVDCNNGNAAIATATNQAYTVTSNGSYAVMITLNNCSKTSTCTSITTVGMQHLAATNELKIYPNPTTGMVNIALKDADKAAHVKIVNSIGQVVHQSTISKDNNQINIQHYNAGLYFIQIDNNKPVRLIKE